MPIHRRPPLPTLIALVFLMLTASLLGACNKVQRSQESESKASADAAKPAAAEPAPPPEERKPDLKITTVDNGEYDLAAHRGKWIVVNFWATWCHPCLKEMPELSALDAMRDHIEVIGLAYEEIEPADMRAFLKKHPVVYPIAIVDTYNPPKAFETPRGLPMTYLIGPDGRIADTFLGPVTAEQIEKAVAKAGGPQPGADLAPKT